MFFAVIVIFLAIIIAIAILTVQQMWRFRTVHKIPGPAALPLMGNALEFGLTPSAVLHNLDRLARQYGTIYKIKLGPINLHLVISDPDLSEFFINSTRFLTKTKEYDIFKPLLENGLLTSSGAHWQNRKKIITPTFHFKILKEFMPVFDSLTNVLVRKLLQEVDKDICDVEPLVTAYALDTICATAMGVTLNVQENPENEYFTAMKVARKIFVEAAFAPWQQFETLYKYTENYRNREKTIKIIQGFTKSVIKKRHQELLEENNKSISPKVEDDIGSKKRQAFLDLLMHSTIDGKPLTDEDIREEVDTFMAAGHETTASAICFIMYELSRNPEVQQKAYEELNEVFHGDKNPELNITVLSELNYLEQVIKETLRMYPSVPFFARELTEDVEHKGIIYPKGVALIFFAYGMHRRADLYPDPEKFDPERFNVENSRGRHPFAYIPFSAGPRNCPGYKFAMYELKTTLAKIILNLKLFPVDPKYDVILASEVSLKSLNGVHMRLEKR